MAYGLFRSYIEKLVSAPAPEWTTRGSKYYTPQVLLAMSPKTLEDGRVFAVYRYQGYTFFLRKGCNQGARSNKGLLVGKGQIFPCLNSSKGRCECCCTYYGRYHKIRLTEGRHGFIAFFPIKDLSAGRLSYRSDLICQFRGHYSHDPGIEFSYLFHE